jgi:hypothetical protein
LGKAALTAPLYISIAWSLIISYQLFTQTAVYSLIYFLSIFSPSAEEFIISRISTIVFVHTFAWIFVLSSVIPSIILGKGRSVLLQFFLCLTITFVAVSVEDILTLIMGAAPTAQVQNLAFLFQNPLVAGVYLSAPYLIMLYLDISERRKGKKEEENLQETETIHVKETPPAEQQETLITAVPDKNMKTRKSRQDRGMNFLYGAAVACFLLSFTPSLLENAFATNILAMAFKPVYVATLTIIGTLLLGLGIYSKTPRPLESPTI